MSNGKIVIMRLSELKPGQTGVILKILGHGAFRKRVIEMGFVRGRKISALLSAPMKDPVKYSLMGYEVSLRLSEARMVEILPIADADSISSSVHTNTITDTEELNTDFDRESRVINVALIGNPNCGKTSIFNIAAGAKEHVGNYSGVTVDAKKGHFKYKDYTFNFVDLPGTYSLAAYSPEELYVRRYLLEQNPDIILNVVDASNIERNLYLTTELINMDRSMVIALNMYDEIKRAGTDLDYKQLGEMIGVPIVPTVARTGDGINDVCDTIIDVFEGRDATVRHIHVNLGHDVEDSLTEIKDRLKQDPYISKHFSPRYLAIKLLERDREVEDIVKETPNCSDILELRDRKLELIENYHQEDISSIIANEKYGFIAGALAETMVQRAEETRGNTRIIDAFVTNRLFGFPIFLAIMFFIFWATFAVGAYPQGWIESGVSWLAELVHDYFPAGPLKDLLADGVIGGVGGVIVFLPNILILYFFISFMEESGYMARAAFIMDKVMHRVGLHGKSFIPLVMGFGCNVPAILASRSIESRSSRLITILINPFMSCSARLPIYVLLVGSFFSAHAGLVFFGLYLMGIVVAVITARLLRRFHFKADETPFVMELPPYRIPTLKSTFRHMWWKGQQYIRKMGGIILVASVVVWALNYFPLGAADGVESNAEGTEIKDSYLCMMGKTIEPVMAPIGMGWKASVAALAGVPAKEIVVSTLGVLYTGDDDTTDSALGARIKSDSNGRPDFTPASALAYMIFILLYCPCLATIMAIVKETGKIYYGVFSVVYNTAVAWVMAFIVYHIAILF